MSTKNDMPPWMYERAKQCYKDMLKFYRLPPYVYLRPKDYVNNFSLFDQVQRLRHPIIVIKAAAGMLYKNHEVKYGPR